LNELTDGTVCSVDAATGAEIGPYRKSRLKGRLVGREGRPMGKTSASVLLILFLMPMAVCVAIPVLAEEMNLTGKWVGTWSTGRSRGSFDLNLVQTEKELSGKVFLGNRASLPTSFEAPLSGKVDGTNVRIQYVTPESINVAVELKVSPPGKLEGTGRREYGVRIEISLRRSD